MLVEVSRSLKLYGKSLIFKIVLNSRQRYAERHFKTKKPILSPTVWTSGAIYRYPPQGFMIMFTMQTVDNTCEGNYRPLIDTFIYKILNICTQ